MINGIFAKNVFEKGNWFFSVEMSASVGEKLTEVHFWFFFSRHLEKTSVGKVIEDSPMYCIFTN